MSLLVMDIYWECKEYHTERMRRNVSYTSEGTTCTFEHYWGTVRGTYTYSNNTCTSEDSKRWLLVQ